MNKKQKIRDMMFCTEMIRERRLYPVWAKIGLIAGQPRVPFQLSQKDRITQKGLSDACRIEPTILSRALDRLETMRCITRNDNPDCQCSFLIEITKEGKSMAKQACQTFTEVEEQMTEGFSVEEMDLIENILGWIYENLEQKQENVLVEYR